MADNIAVTPGSGASIATDDAGAGGHVQIVKLAIATDGSATLIPAVAADGLLVNLGTNNDVTNGGTFLVQVDGAALTALQLIDDAVYVDDADWTDSTSKHFLIGGLYQSTPQTITDGDVGPLQVDSNGKLLMSGSATISGAVDATLTPATTGGLSTMNATSSDGGTALTSTAQAIKAAAGQLFGYYIYNPNDEVSYVNFYNTASGSVTVGTTNPLFHLAIPPASAANLLGETGIAFSTAISWSATKTAGSSTAPDTAFEAVAFYK